MEWIIIDIIESILITWFISLFVDIKKYKWIYWFLLTVCNFILITISNYFDMYDIYLSTIVIITSVFISYLFTYNSIYDLLLISCFEAIYSCLISCLVIFVSLLWKELNSSILQQVFYVIGIVFISSYIKKEKIYLSKETTLILASILFFMHFVLQYFLQLYLIVKVELPEIMITFVMMVMCVLGIFILFFKISQLHKNQDEYKKLKQQMENEKVLSYLYEQLKITKHDLKHSYNLLNYYIENNDLDKIKELVQNKSDLIDTMPTLIQSKNKLLNIIMNNKVMQAYIKNIQIESHIMIGEQIYVSDYDFNDLLSNILDNAIENNKENGRISIDILQEDKFLHMKFTNTVDEKVSSHHLITKKNKKEHGYGLKSIEKVVHKYHGTLDMCFNQGIFEMKITLITIEQ